MQEPATAKGEHRYFIFVPGKNPKPPPEQHRKALWRTLVEGVRRAEPEVAAELQAWHKHFKLAAWNFLYYHSYKDINRDLPWIDALLNKHGPTPTDIREAHSWQRRLGRFLFALGDRLPFLIPLLPEPIRMTAQETRRYFQNQDDIACEVREVLKRQLRPLLNNGEKILLIGHSLGSVIAYDTLWELTHEEHLPGKVDLFLTLGSPLGMRYVKRRLQGAHDRGARRYPHNIRRWVNIAAIGDVTALDRELADDYHEMVRLGLTESIEDHCRGIYNYFRNEQGLNVHRSYGYLVNPAVGKVIADWWAGTD